MLNAIPNTFLDDKGGYIDNDDIIYFELSECALKFLFISQLREQSLIGFGDGRSTLFSNV